MDHSVAPWVIGKSYNPDAIAIRKGSPEGACLAEVTFDDLQPKQCESNAILISHAPEMLDLLIRILTVSLHNADGSLTVTSQEKLRLQKFLEKLVTESYFFGTLQDS